MRGGRRGMKEEEERGSCNGGRREASIPTYMLLGRAGNKALC